MISKETIETIHNSSDIVQIIGEYTKLEKRGFNDWWGCCPIHHEKTASFHVDGDKHFYYCFGCHASGDVIKFVMEMEKLSYSDAIVSLAKKIGIPVKYEGSLPQDFKKEDNKADEYIDLYDRTSTMFHYLLVETEQGKKALEYIKSRGLSEEIIKKFKLGYSPADGYWLKKFLLSKNFSDNFLNESGLFCKNNNNWAFFCDRLMFPIFNRKGQTVAFGGRILHEKGENDRKYLNSGDLIQYKKRETLYAFNFAKNSIRENKKIIICEGYMDCIAYHASGIEYAVAPLGTALTEEQIKMIMGFVDTVLLSFDSDNAGQNATIKSIYLCRKQNLTVKIIQLQGGKDPAEILLNYGKENLTAQVNNAILDSDYLLNRLGKLYPIDTPEGKSRAALEYFDYIDCLTSDIQKESSLELLSQKFNLKPEAVKRDFLNRKQTQKRLAIREEDSNKNIQITQINLNAELRGLIAVSGDADQFNVMRSCLKVTDFQNPTAQRLFKILEDCFVNGTYTIPGILSKCNENEDTYKLSTLISSAISSDVYKKENLSQITKDTVNLVKKNLIDKQRDEILKQIREMLIVTEDDKKKQNELLIKKMELDREALKLSK